MAGDWIKVEQATVDKPEVLRLAELMGWHRRQALGLLVEFWCWLDKNLSEECPDFVRHMSRKSLDEVLHVPGFAAALEHVGWAKFDDECAVMHIVNAERHNGNTAKTRALDAKRKKEKRRQNVQQMSVSDPDVSGTREEKRRDIYTRKSPETPLPKDFVLSERVKSWGATKGYTPEALTAHFENFILQAAAKGYTYRDWDSALIKAVAADWAKVGKGSRRLAV